MRIFVFTARYPAPYKPYYDTQFVDLLRRGHDLRIFAAGSLDGSVNEKVRRHGLRERTRSYPAVARAVPTAASAYARNLTRRPLACIAAAARLARRRGGGKELLLRIFRMLAVNESRPDLCFVHELITAVRFQWLRDAFPGVPVAMYYHGGEVPSIAELPSGAPARAFAAMDIVFTNTEFSRRHAIARGCPPERVRILPMGFALEDFDPPPRKTRSGPLKLFSAGRMSEEKGFVYALEALTKLADEGITDVEYSLTGEGYVRPKLEEFVRRNGLARQVRFLGTLSTRGVLDRMAEAHVLVLPSVRVGNWVENQACAVQEAMLQRCLVVTSRTGGVPQSIPECMRPFSVPPGDSDALAAVLKKAYVLTPAEREALADRCRAFVVENYDIRKLNDRMLAVVQEVAGHAAPRPPARSRASG